MYTYLSTQLISVGWTWENYPWSIEILLLINFCCYQFCKHHLISAWNDDDVEILILYIFTSDLLVTRRCALFSMNVSDFPTFTYIVPKCFFLSRYIYQLLHVQNWLHFYFRLHLLLYVHMYSDTCLNWTPLGRALLFGIDRCPV